MSSTRPSTKSATTRAKSRSSDGFTLLELLVAISIFSLVVGMAMFSLRYAFGVFRHLDAPYAEETRRITGLRDAVASTFPYVAERSDMFNRNKEFFTCFNGEHDRMTFVSTKPVALTGPTLCRLSLRDKDVVLEEVPLFAADRNYLNPQFEGSGRKETVIFENVQRFALEYFQGDKKLDTMKEEIPSLVRVALVSEDKQQEFFLRVQAPYNDKKKVIQGQHEGL